MTANVNKILKLAQKGMTYREISNFLGDITPLGVKYYFKKYNLPIHKRKTHRIHFFDETAFDTIDSEFKAYWLGFLMGDGCISNGVVRIDIHKNDIEHLNKFKNFLQTDAPICDGKGDCVLVRACSRHMTDSLIKYNIIPNKTYLESKLPKIKKSLLKHYCRGILDSDGWITSYTKREKLQVSFGFSSKSFNFLKDIQNFICNEINQECGSLRNNIRFDKRINKETQCCSLIFDGNKMFKKIYKLLYLNSNIYLDRKYELASKFFQILN